MKQDFVHQLRRALRESGQPQGSIYRATGIPQGNISRLLSGQRMMTLRNFSKLCARLGLELRSK